MAEPFQKTRKDYVGNAVLRVFDHYEQPRGSKEAGHMPQRVSQKTRAVKYIGGQDGVKHLRHEFRFLRWAVDVQEPVANKRVGLILAFGMFEKVFRQVRES